MDTWYLYLIRCLNGSLYAGITKDVDRRFKEHQESGKKTARYLRGKGPLTLEFSKVVGDHGSALRIERLVKKMPKIKKEKLILGQFGLSELIIKKESTR